MSNFLWFVALLTFLKTFSGFNDHPNCLAKIWRVWVFYLNKCSKILKYVTGTLLEKYFQSSFHYFSRPFWNLFWSSVVIVEGWVTHNCIQKSRGSHFAHVHKSITIPFHYMSISDQNNASGFIAFKNNRFYLYSSPHFSDSKLSSPPSSVAFRVFNLCKTESHTLKAAILSHDHQTLQHHN